MLNCCTFRYYDRTGFINGHGTVVSVDPADFSLLIFVRDTEQVMSSDGIMPGSLIRAQFSDITGMGY